METPKPKKPLLEDYRDNLANDLREMRNLGDKEDARNVLNEERETRRYQMAESLQAQEREDAQKEFKNRKENKLNEEKNLLEKYGITPEQREKFEAEMEKYLKSSGLLDRDVDMRTVWKNPLKINTKELVDDKNKDEYGQFMTNPETAFLDYSQFGEPEIFRPLYSEDEFLEWVNKNGRKDKNKGYHGFGKEDVFDYIIEKYEDEYYIPGLEYLKYLRENPDKVPAYFRDRKEQPGDFRLAVIGSVIRGEDGFNSGFNSKWVENYEEKDISTALKKRVWGNTMTDTLWAQNCLTNPGYAYVFFKKPKKP